MTLYEQHVSGTKDRILRTAYSADMRNAGIENMQLSCVGEMVVDFLPGEGEGVYICMSGGAPANVAVAAARQGVEVGFCGCVGNDDFGRFLLQTLECNRVTSLCPEPTNEAVTTMAFVTLGDNGERSFTFARKPGADMLLTESDVDRANAADATIVHAGSCSLSGGSAAQATRHALEIARRLGRMVSFDINYRKPMWDGDRAAARDSVQEVLPLVDFLKLSDEEVDMLGCGPEDAVRRYGISVLVNTHGENGAECFFGGERLVVRGIPSLCVDSTGAGDAFWGGFLSCLLNAEVKRREALNRQLIVKALGYGNIAGALCVRKKGAMDSLPYKEETEKLYSEVYE